MRLSDSSASLILLSSRRARKRLQFFPNSNRSPASTSAACSPITGALNPFPDIKASILIRLWLRLADLTAVRTLRSFFGKFVCSLGNRCPGIDHEKTLSTLGRASLSANSRYDPDQSCAQQDHCCRFRNRLGNFEGVC